MSEQPKASEMTYGQVFARFTAKYPTFAVDDYRPAAGVGYGLIIWEKGTHDMYLVQYQPGLDEFFVLGRKERCHESILH